MKQYLKQCNTKNEYTIWKYTDAPDTHTAYIANGDEVVYGHPENVDEYYYEPLSMEILDSDYNGTYRIQVDNLIVGKSNNGEDPYIEYSYDNELWQGGSDPIIPKNGKVYIATNMAHSGEGLNIRPSGHANYKIAGNVLSLGGGHEMNIPDDVKIKYSFKDDYNGGTLTNAENLWMPYWGIGDNTFQSCNKAPHILINKIDFSNDSNVWQNEKPDIKSADITNVVMNFPKTLKIKRPSEGEGRLFNCLFALDENNQTAVPYKFPQVMSFSGDEHVLIEKTYMNRTIAPLTQNYYIIAKNIGINQMFDGAQIADLSNIHIMGDINYSWTYHTFANSSVEKAAKLYQINDLDSETYTDSPNLTDVYYYGYRLPDNMGLSTDFAGNIHYAPWLNSDSLSDKQSQYTNATWVEDTDAILFMTWKFTDGDEVYYDDATWYDAGCESTDPSYPNSFNFSVWQYGGIELFDNTSLISHVIINNEWLPLTFEETVDIDGVNAHKFSYTYNNETHYIYIRRTDAQLICRKKDKTPINLVYSNNVPDELKFRYINAE